MKERKQRARTQGARLKKFLGLQGISLPHKQCLEAVAAMNGAKNWQTFEASNDADFVVNDPDALRDVVETVLEATFFESLPQGTTLATLYRDTTAANAATEAGEGWHEQKARMNAIWEPVTERDLNIPPARWPVVLDAAIGAATQALRARLTTTPEKPKVEGTEIFRRLMQDWRIAEGETDIPPTDARTYVTRVTNRSMVEMTCAYPHTSMDDLDLATPQLSACLEINGGLPCLHLYTDIYSGEALVSVFAARNGELILRVNSDSYVMNYGSSEHPLAQKLSIDRRSLIVKVNEQGRLI